MVVHRFELNGDDVGVEAPADMPLLWVLRDLLQLTGTKYGCGVMQCGACTVHLDGVAARTCQLPISQVVGRRVTTIEGLSREGQHPVQAAWIEAQVPQCGYCQSGQLMTAAALLARTKRPSRPEIDAAMAGHICRCGTYLRIRRAIERAAVLAQGEASAEGQTGDVPSDAGVQDD